MKSSNKDAIRNSISYIESRLQEKLEMDELASHVYFSKTHYQRLFHAIVGEPVMEYIKKRRLQQACQMLCQTNATILDIALEFGYTAHEGFTRAFKAQYGIPPNQYRKRYASDHYELSTSVQEVTNMSANEYAKKIAQHVKAIIDDLAQFSNDLDKLCVFGEDAVTQLGPNGKGVKIVICELKNLALKTRAILDYIAGISGDNQSAYEISDAIYVMLKDIDELTFQLNLIRFLSGIEVLRTGGIDVLTVFQSDLTDLSESLLKHNDRATDILKELLSLLLSDIKNESVINLRAAVAMIKQTADVGRKLAEETRVLSEELMPYGAGFMSISLEIDKKSERIDDVAEVITIYADKLAAEEIGIVASDSTVSTATSIDRALASLTEIAFTMNLVAFNANVETARAGDREQVAELCGKIIELANQIHQTTASSKEYCNESSRLAALAEKSLEANSHSTHQQFQSAFDDIIFQGGILSSQLRMESSRAGLDIFVGHANVAEVAVAKLSETRKYDYDSDLATLATYIDEISLLAKTLLSDAEANMPRGTTFVYIAKEFEVFVEKMRLVVA